MIIGNLKKNIPLVTIEESELLQCKAQSNENHFTDL